MDAFSTPRNRTISLILLAACAVLAVTAAIIGVDDNFPGILAALLAAVAFILAFTHPWKQVRKYLFLMLAAVLGFILFIAVNIVTDLVFPRSSQSALLDAVYLILIQLITAGFLVGLIGMLVVWIRSRRKA